MRRGWVSEQELLDLIGGASLLPGPTSTEVALMLARRRGGWGALLVGGACFISPSVLLVLGLSWAYVRYGTTEAGEGVLYGIKPVVIAIIANAVFGLARTAIKSWTLACVAGAGLTTYFLGVSPLAILLVAAALVAVVENRDRWARPGGAEKGIGHGPVARLQGAPRPAPRDGGGRRPTVALGGVLGVLKARARSCSAQAMCSSPTFTATSCSPTTG